MRQTRRDWWPQRRIPALKRYAFIGDSTMFGAGLQPDESLPAHAGRLLNAALPAWPVEAVNFGVSGYNLWNSWQGVKPDLALFDGLVIALCNNDAEMFSRTYRLQIPEVRIVSFEPDDPFGAAFACCFTEISQTCQSLGLPVAVIFYNAHNTKPMLRMDEVIAGHCAANGILYFPTLPLYMERNLPREQLVANAGDPHPSSLAHELVARHLVTEMARLGWFKAMDEKAVDEKAMDQAPARIRTAARAMIDDENFPEDAAIAWALGVLEAKALVARRRAALGEADAFSPAAALVRAELEAAGRLWHGTHRAAALALEVSQSSWGLSGTLMVSQLTRERYEELGFALRQPAARGALARLSFPPPEVPPDTAPVEPREALVRLSARFAEQSAALAALVPLLGAAPLRPLMHICGRLREETQAQILAFEQILSLLHTHGAELPPAQLQGLRDNLQAESERLVQYLETAADSTGWAPRISRPLAAPYTTVEAVLRTSAVTLPSAILTLRADYVVPHRLSFASSCMFLTAQQPVTLRFHVPLFYAARVALLPFRSARAASPEDIEVIKLEFINAPGTRRTVPKDSWYRDDRGNLNFPLVSLV